MEFGPPPKDVEYQLAHELWAQESQLDRAILHELVGQPCRYGDLKPLLGGRGDFVLTKALKRMRSKGIIKHGVDLRSKQGTYALTNLGKLVVFRMHEMVPIERSLDAFARGQPVHA